MKNFLATTAAALVLGTAAYADDHTGAFSDEAFDAAVNLNASELIGKRLYASEADIENNATIASVDELEWNDIGEINEIILTRDGEVQSVIIGVGGFIGIGEKDVSVNMDQIRFVTEDDNDDYFLVINASAAGVEDAPSYERTSRDTMMADDAMTDDAMAEDTMVDDTAEMDADTMERTPMTAPAVEREGYQTVAVEDLTTEDLTGARVYGVQDEDIGEVSELLLTESGDLDRAIIDVGGFLGIGEYPVAVPMDELQIIRDDNGTDVRVYIESSQEALEAQPEYEG